MKLMNFSLFLVSKYYKNNSIKIQLTKAENNERHIFMWDALTSLLNLR